MACLWHIGGGVQAPARRQQEGVLSQQLHADDAPPVVLHLKVRVLRASPPCQASCSALLDSQKTRMHFLLGSTSTTISIRMLASCVSYLMQRILIVSVLP